jgi:hypothetical protein
MHRAFAVPVVAKGFQRQRLEHRFFFGKHSGDLPLGGAVNPRARGRGSFSLGKSSLSARKSTVRCISGLLWNTSASRFSQYPLDLFL